MKADLVNRLRDYAAECKGEIADLTREAAEAIEELQAGKWVSVKGRLPEVKHNGFRSDYVIIAYRTPTGEVAVSDGTAFCNYDNVWCWDADDEIDISIVPILYWMPLPEPPKSDLK